MEREAVERLKATLLEAIQAFCDAYEPGAAGSPAVVSAPTPADPERLRLATAALLLLMSRADHATTAEERDAIAAALTTLLDASLDETRGLVRVAEEEQLGVPLADLVHLLDAAYSVEQKKQVVESLWCVAFADAEILAHEEYLARKISDLLHLTQADLIETKVRAKEAFR